MTQWRIALFSFLLVTAGAGADDVALARGAELLAPFKHDLKAALADGMQNGPATAIGVCRVKAPRIARALSVDGVTVGRSSHRLRNAANATPTWAAPVLQAYLDNGDDRDPRVVALSSDRWGYVEPIVTQPMCIACHGEELSDELRAGLEVLYPNDAATGFKVGDLRGIFWAEFPAHD